MFDVRAINPVTVTGLSTAIEDIGHPEIQIWGRTGSHVGHTTSFSGWTLLGTVNLTSGGTGSRTVVSLPLALDIPLQAGDTYAFMLRRTDPPGAANPNNIGYSDGVGSAGSTVAGADANLQVLLGTGADFDLTKWFSPRQLVGEVMYRSGANVTPSPTVTPVPTLSAWALGLLAVLSALVASGRGRRHI